MINLKGKFINNSTLKSYLSNVGGGHQLAKSNIKAINHYLSQSTNEKNKKDFLAIDYSKNDYIVKDGIASDINENNFSYSKVPLGLILKGEITITKDGKATKTLNEGDFIGLFETSDWLLNRRKIKLGNWTLKASENTKVVFIGESLFKQDKDSSNALKKYLIDIARNDIVPQPITTLPLLDWVANHTIDTSGFDNTIIIAHTHLLPNNFPFFRHLASLVGPSRLFVLEKPYSTVKKVFNDLIKSGVEVFPVKMDANMPYEFATQKSLEILWRRVFEEQKRTSCNKIVIVDDGGDIWLSIPWNNLKGVSIVGVEQTQRGVSRIHSSTLKIPPIVSVASSGIKKTVESIFIGKSVVKELNKLGIIKKTKKIGILGMGSIGEAVGKALKDLGKDYLFYDSDKNFDNKYFRPSIDVLLNECDLVIGTTGTDSCRGIAFNRVNGKKFFASASSADVEFSSLLKLTSNIKKLFEIIPVKVHKNLTINILNGGYPINFNRKTDATPDNDIVLTRSLMYIGVMQAVKLFNKKPGIYNIDKISQKKLLEEWTKQKKISNENIPISIKDIDKIVNYSSSENLFNIPSIWRS